jgi:hypothetical protein
MANLGFTPKTAGTVLFEGTDIPRLPPHEIARRAVARTFQIVQPFAETTVRENVLAGGLFAGRRATLTDPSQASVRCLEFVGLDRFARDPASQLSLANRQRLELAKSLAMQPRLLFLDEVNAGLNSADIDGAFGADMQNRCDRHHDSDHRARTAYCSVPGQPARRSTSRGSAQRRGAIGRLERSGCDQGLRHQAELEQQRQNYQNAIEKRKSYP